MMMDKTEEIFVTMPPPKNERWRELSQLLLFTVFKGLLKLEWAVESGRVNLSPSDIAALLELSNILESAGECEHHG